MKPDHEFANKVAIVTGAASGIGFETAKLFSARGAKVALLDLSKEKLDRAMQEFSKQGAKAWVCDVSKEDQVQSVVSEVQDHFGQLDIVVNNAGLMIFKPLEEHTADDWFKVLSVDLMGAFYFTKQAFLRMKKGGAVVNV